MPTVERRKRLLGDAARFSWPAYGLLEIFSHRWPELPNLKIAKKLPITMNIKTLTLIAAALWISFFILLAIGMFYPDLRILCFAAAPDGMLALAFTITAARRWTHG